MANSTRRRMFEIAAGLTIMAASVAPGHAAGTPEQRRACRGDAFRLCREYIPAANRVKACMLANFSKLSPPCRAQFEMARRHP